MHATSVPVQRVVGCDKAGVYNSTTGLHIPANLIRRHCTCGLRARDLALSAVYMPARHVVRESAELLLSGASPP